MKYWLLIMLVAPFWVTQALSETTQSSALTGQVAFHYVKLGHAMYSDALHTVNLLDEKISAFIVEPSETNHTSAKQAWINAHAVYSQTEVFRFGNPNVDDWEGQVNAWPMDEGLVDYVAAGYHYEESNPHALENIIADDVEINEQLLRTMHENAGSEANVATGYHAIEFLLWGQDLNETAKSAGKRSYTDYLRTEECTHSPCDRRATYLATVVKVLQQDLAEMVAQWEPQTGSYAKEFMTLTSGEQLHRILFGMGSLSFGELAAERIRVALLANAQEDEQSCFSDTTDIAIYNNAVGVRNIYTGFYLTSDGREIEGPSISKLVEKNHPEVYTRFEQELALTLASAYAISGAAENGEPFDQQILAQNKIGNERLQKMIDRLRSQTATIEEIAKLMVIL